MRGAVPPRGQGRRRVAPEPTSASPGPVAGASPAGRRAPGGSSTGPSTCASSGRWAVSSRAAVAAGGPSTAAMCTAGGSPTSVLASSSDSACATGSHRISACTVGMDDSATTRRRRRRRCAGPGRRRPSTDAVRPRRRADPACRAAPSRRAAARPRSRLRRPVRRRVSRRRAQARRARADDRVAARGDDGGAGKRPAELLGRAARTHDDGAHRVGPAPHAAQCGVGPAAPSADRPRVVAFGQRHGPGAVPAPGDGPAFAARQRGHVAPSWHLDEHWALRLERGPRRVQRHRRQPGGVGGRVAFLREATVVDRDDARRARPHHRPGRHQVVRPLGAHQRLPLCGTRVTTDQCGAAHLVCPQHRHLARMRVRGTWLGEAVVAVVPHHHQTEVGDRCEHRTPGADHQTGATA